MNWQDVKKMHDAGFEIGNHTKSHPDMTKLSKEKIRAEIEHIEQQCKKYDIAVPRTFCYPGFHCNRDVVEVLREKGYLFARRGVGPEFPDNDNGARGPEYDPGLDHPLLIPCTGYSGPDWGFEDFVWELRKKLARTVDDFSLPDYEGQSHKFSDLRGKVTLLAFWTPT